MISVRGEEAGQRKPSDGNFEHTALTSSPTKRHVGDFDAYVQTEQEKKARAEYQEYCNENDPADILSFEDWCDWKNEPTGLDLTPFWEALKPKELRSVPTNPETGDMVDVIGAHLGSVA